MWSICLHVPRPPAPRLSFLWLSFSCDTTSYAYISILGNHMLGSDGTVSLWDKDARTRMKSKPPSPLSRWSPSGGLFASIRGVFSFVRHSPPITYYLVVGMLTNHAIFHPCAHHHQRSAPCQVPSLAHLSTILGRCSPTRRRMTGRRDTPGTFLRIGTRFYCTGVRRMKLGNGHPRPGWVRSDFPVNRSFSCFPPFSPCLPSPSCYCPMFLS